MIDNANTVLCDLPPRVRSFVRENDDGSNTIVLNARLSRECQELAYLHEIVHLINEDCGDSAPADQIEKERH